MEFYCYDDIFFLTKMSTRLIGQDLNGCWNWSCKKGKYGHITIVHNKKLGIHTVKAHRKSAEIFIGDIKGKEVMHMCDNPRCFNPDHLKIGTTSDNVQDMHNKKRHRWSKATHCAQGHKFNKENTYITKRNQRQCRMCGKLRMRKVYNKRREKIGEEPKIYAN